MATDINLESTGGNFMTDNISSVRAIYSGLSQRKVAATHQVSRNTISLLLKHAKENGWQTTEDLEGIDEVHSDWSGC